MRISRFPTTSEDDLGIRWQKHMHMVKWREKLKAIWSTYYVEYSPPKKERQQERQEYEESIKRSSCHDFPPTADRLILKVGLTNSSEHTLYQDCALTSVEQNAYGFSRTHDSSLKISPFLEYWQKAACGKMAGAAQGQEIGPGQFLLTRLILSSPST